MKQLFLIFTIVLFALSSTAQEKQKYVYCQIHSIPEMDGKIAIKIDLGHKSNTATIDVLKNPQTGKAMKFNSIIAAINYLAFYGWELHLVFTPQNFSEPRYILRAEVKNLTEQEQIDFFKRHKLGDFSK